jgi:hypothetical protein
MYIEAVIVCVNYSDFLSHTLPTNKHLFNKVVVVTDTKDNNTKKVCDLHNVLCIQTDTIYTSDSKIPNKGVAINAGLEALDKKGWVVQLDADIYLPTLTRTILESYPLNVNYLYSIDRLMCNSYEDWYNYMHHNKKPVHEGWIYLHTDIFSIGTRMVQYHGDGYWPIGYFQMWNPNHTLINRYPQAEGYDRSDVQFLKLWKRAERHLIPDLLCIHLASDSHTMGQNWKGRSTPMFAPVVEPGRFEMFIQKIKMFMRKIFKNRKFKKCY